MNTKLFYRVCCGLAFGAGAWSILPQHGDPIYGKSIVNTNRPPTPTGALVLTNGYARFIDMNDFLRQAITNGEVCAIVGHQWNPYEGTILIHPVYPPEPIPVYRVCALCKRTEQQFTEWKVVTP